MMAVREKVKKNILSCTQRRDQEHLNTVNNVMCVQKSHISSYFSGNQRTINFLSPPQPVPSPPRPSLPSRPPWRQMRGLHADHALAEQGRCGKGGEAGDNARKTGLENLAPA